MRRSFSALQKTSKNRGLNLFCFAIWYKYTSTLFWRLRGSFACISCYLLNSSFYTMIRSLYNWGKQAHFLIEFSSASTSFSHMKPSQFMSKRLKANCFKVCTWS